MHILAGERSIEVYIHIYIYDLELLEHMNSDKYIGSGMKLSPSGWMLGLYLYHCTVIIYTIYSQLQQLIKSPLFLNYNTPP